MSTIKNIIDDTLKSRGKWSMKRLTAFVVMVFVLALGVFIVVSDKILIREVNRYAIDVFQSLLFFEAALMGINEFGKKLANKEPKTEEAEQEIDSTEDGTKESLLHAYMNTLTPEEIVRVLNYMNKQKIGDSDALKEVIEAWK